MRQSGSWGAEETTTGALVNEWEPPAGVQTLLDAAQDSYVQLYLHWDKVGGSAEPEAWLYRVAVDRCRDYRGRLARGAKLFRPLVAEAPAAATVGAWEPANDFVALLRQLPTRQRVAAALFYQADMSIYEISQVMGISEGAVNSHLNRARRTLKALLEAGG